MHLAIGRSPFQAALAGFDLAAVEILGIQPFGAHPAPGSDPTAPSKAPMLSGLRRDGPRVTVTMVVANQKFERPGASCQGVRAVRLSVA